MSVSGSQRKVDPETSADDGRATAERLLQSLVDLDSVPNGRHVSRLEHSLQCASHAWRDGADIDWIVTALLHDIGELFAPANHDEFAAAILRPYVREQCTWVAEKHGDFQKAYYGDADDRARAQYVGEHYFEDCDQFCQRWDQDSLGTGYDTLPLEFFRPLVQEVFSRKPFDPMVIRPGDRSPIQNPSVAEARSRTIKPV